jgi:hypothetical protein
MKNSLFVSALAFVSSSIFAQASIDFKEKVYDFGFVKEGTQAQHLFTFENNGNDTLLLTNVQAQCGCTTPNWSKEGIVAGENGEIMVSYNSSGRLGSFYKTVTVMNNATTEPIKLIIKGLVVSPDQLPADSLFGKIAPSLKFDKSEIKFGKVENGKAVSAEIKVSNTSKNSVKLVSSGTGCSCTFVEPDFTVNAGETKVLKLTFTPRELGNLSEKLALITNDSGNPVYEVILKAESVQTLTAPKTIMEQNTGTGFGF